MVDFKPFDHPVSAVTGPVVDTNAYGRYFRFNNVFDQFGNVLIPCAEVLTFHANVTFSSFGGGAPPGNGYFESTSPITIRSGFASPNQAMMGFDDNTSVARPVTFMDSGYHVNTGTVPTTDGNTVVPAATAGPWVISDNAGTDTDGDVTFIDEADQAIVMNEVSIGGAQVVPCLFNSTGGGTRLARLDDGTSIDVGNPANLPAVFTMCGRASVSSVEALVFVRMHLNRNVYNTGGSYVSQTTATLDPLPFTDGDLIYLAS